MIRIDEHDIIVQHNPNDPSYADGGDSINRNGLMAMTGDTFFLKTLPLFVVDHGQLCRHPYQNGWIRDPKEMSRDQLVAYAGGVNRYIKTPNGTDMHLILRHALANYASKWFINKDILMPDVRLGLFKAAGEIPPFYLKVLGYPMMVLSLMWAAWIRPNEEQNQMISLCSIYGRGWLKALYKMHPDLSENLKEYWGGYPFRDQQEIYVVLRDYIVSEVNK